MLRFLLALLMFAGILWLLGGYLRHVVHGPPPDPELADVTAYGLKYICSMCGLELRVEKVAQDKPPRHCGEAMELVHEGGRPPLRPLPDPPQLRRGPDPENL